MRKREIQIAGTQTLDYSFQVDLRDMKHIFAWNSNIPTESRFCPQIGSAFAKWVHGRN